jgi:DNA polymerase-3 subunit gamma/tau
LALHLEKICEAEGVKVAKGVIPLVVRASGGSVRDALSVLGQLLAGAGKDGVSYEIAIQLLGFTDGALLDDALDAIAARDGATLFKTIDRVIESGHDPRRFTSDLLERLRDLMIVDALKDSTANSILRDLPEDQMERMRNQSNRIGAANLSRAADIAAEGLTQMRGATAPRLILELICGRILLPIGDSSDAGMLSRIERLERAENIAPLSSTRSSETRTAESARSLDTRVADSASVRNVEAKEKAASTHSTQAEGSTKSEAVAPRAEAGETVAANTVGEKAKETAPSAAPKEKVPGNFDITALRRAWPDVIEDVKKRRRLTWSLLSASAQVLSVDADAITIGIINPGAKESFERSESDVILRNAFIDVVGIDRKIAVVVDPSIDTNTPTARETRTSEAPSDPNQLSGAALLMQELGAQVIEGK